MVDSQIEILKSDNFALSIIKKLGLTQDPEFVGSGGGLIGSVISLPFQTRYTLLPSNIPKSEFDDPHSASCERFEKRLTVSRVGMTYVIEIEF